MKLERRDGLGLWAKPQWKDISDRVMGAVTAAREHSREADLLP